jgi:hypothetical protein
MFDGRNSPAGASSPDEEDDDLASAFAEMEKTPEEKASGGGSSHLGKRRHEWVMPGGRKRAKKKTPFSVRHVKVRLECTCHGDTGEADLEVRVNSLKEVGRSAYSEVFVAVSRPPHFMRPDDGDDGIWKRSGLPWSDRPDVVPVLPRYALHLFPDSISGDLTGALAQSGVRGVWMTSEAVKFVSGGGQGSARLCFDALRDCASEAPQRRFWGIAVDGTRLLLGSTDVTFLPSSSPASAPKWSITEGQLAVRSRLHREAAHLLNQEATPSILASVSPNTPAPPPTTSVPYWVCLVAQVLESPSRRHRNCTTWTGGIDPARGTLIEIANFSKLAFPQESCCAPARVWVNIGPPRPSAQSAFESVNGILSPRTQLHLTCDRCGATRSSSGHFLGRRWSKVWQELLSTQSSDFTQEHWTGAITKKKKRKKVKGA